ncbi:MAG: O-antigen ligase family protein [Burkholderiales bacterium]
MAGRLERARAGAYGGARWGAIALGMSIPVSIAGDNILCGLILLAWLASSRLREAGVRLQTNAPAIVGLALWAALAVGLAWGVCDPGDGTQMLGKYADLLLIPVFALLFADARDRRRGLIAYLAAMGVTLALSLALAAGIIPSREFREEIPYVFKLWLTQNILMAIGAYLCWLFGRDAATVRARAAWWAAAALAGLNVLLMVPGRSGMLMLGLLALYAAWTWRGWRALGLAIAIGAAGAAFAAVALPSVAGRFAQIATEARDWQPGHPTWTSTGQRLEFYRVSLGLIAAHPLAGSGTGSFALAYREAVAGTNLEPTRNPHNEYLLLGVQLGVGGVVLLIALWIALWTAAARLPPLERDLARGLALAFAAGCLFNSLLLDHTEGLLFAWLAGLATGALPTRGVRASV